MTRIRTRLALALCALAPFALSGCAGDDKQETPAAVASPAPQAGKLASALDETAARIRTADAELAALVADSVTRPDARVSSFDKAVAALKGPSASERAADTRAALVAVVAAWDASVGATADAPLRAVAEAGRDDAKARLAALDAAVKAADSAVAQHLKRLREVRGALGDNPTSSQRIKSRPISAKVTEDGKLAAQKLAAAAKAAHEAALAPIPAPVEPAPKAAEPEPAPAPETAPVQAAATPVPAQPAATPPVPAKPAEAEPVQAEPKPAADADPVPEPVNS